MVLGISEGVPDWWCPIAKVISMLIWQWPRMLSSACIGEEEPPRHLSPVSARSDTSSLALWIGAELQQSFPKTSSDCDSWHGLFYSVGWKQGDTQMLFYLNLYTCYRSKFPCFNRRCLPETDWAIVHTVINMLSLKAYFVVILTLSFPLISVLAPAVLDDCYFNLQFLMDGTSLFFLLFTGVFLTFCKKKVIFNQFHWGK